MALAANAMRTVSPAAGPISTPAGGAPLAEARAAVRELLLKSEAFTKLPLATQQQIAHDTARVADYLAAPEGIPANTLPNAGSLARSLAEPYTGATYEEAAKQVNRIGDADFKAGAAREGAEVAGLMLQKVNFPTFVAGLIQGVFHAIVQASIEQMEAYGKLVSSVAKSLNQFRDENVSDNQGRDHLTEQFPDLFEIGVSDFGDSAAPRVKLRDDVDESAALRRVNEQLPIEGGPLTSLDLDDEEVEHKLTQAARTQLATSRQQLLATMVLMGINRIVVTDGKIQAKILYDFQARDNMKKQRSAVAFDYARDTSGKLQRMAASEGEYDSSYEGGERTYSRDKEGGVERDQRDGSWYAKGSYKYTEQPVMTAMSTASETTDAALTTKASLAGVVDINFKSDYFPLEKMADSFQIAQIQNASKPGRGAATAGTPASAAVAPGSGTGAAAAPAAAPAPK